MSIYSLQVHSSCDISNMEESRTRGDIHFQSLPHTGTGLKPFSGIVGHKRNNGSMLTKLLKPTRLETIETHFSIFRSEKHSWLLCEALLWRRKDKEKEEWQKTKTKRMSQDRSLSVCNISSDIPLLLLTGDGNWRGLELGWVGGRCSLDYHTNGNGSKNSAVLQKAKRLRQRTMLLQASSQIRPMSSFSQTLKILCVYCDHSQFLPCIAMAKYISLAKVHFS